VDETVRHENALFSAKRSLSCNVDSMLYNVTDSFVIFDFSAPDKIIDKITDLYIRVKQYRIKCRR